MKIDLNNIYLSKNNNLIMITKYTEGEYPFNGYGIKWDNIYNDYTKDGKIFNRGECMFDLIKWYGDADTHPELFL